MTASLRILLPEETVNYVKNPAFRYDTTDWTALGSACTRVLDHARFNIASMKVVTNGVALNEGAFYRVKGLLGISENVTVSAYVRGTGRVRIRLHDTYGQEWYSKPVDLRSTRWQRIWVSGRSSGSDDVRLYVELDERSAKIRTFYIDGAQMERKPYPTSYCDGSQPGCRWGIVDHGSVSTRSSYTRQGGRWVELSGSERELEDLYVTVAGGLGMAPQRLNIQDYSFSPGSFLQNSKVLSRPITLNFHSKKSVDFRKRNASLDHLHSLRQMLIDAVRSDKTKGDEPFRIEYTDGEIPLYIWARYEGGLEGEWDVRNQWINSFAVRFLAVSPFWDEDGQEAAELRFKETSPLNGAHYLSCNIMMRENGEWKPMVAGLDNVVSQVVRGPRGEIIACGSFANAPAYGSVPAKILNSIGYWQEDRWMSFGSGANGIIQGIAVAPNGYVYAVGAFTSIGGVAANRAAYWDGSAWNAMGSGLGALAGDCVAIAPNGDVYVGGNFNTAGGIAAHMLARWDGSSWHPLGPRLGLNVEVKSIAISDDGAQIFVGGLFTDEFGLAANALNFVAEYSPLTDTFSAMGNGLNQQVNRIKVAPSGRVYVCGAFTSTFGGGTLSDRLAYWNGSQWCSIGTGVDNVANDLGFLPNGELIVCGRFTSAGGVSANGIAIWNGSSFSSMDIDTQAEGGDIDLNGGRSVAFVGETLVFATASDSQPPHVPARYASINLITNTGSAETNPVIYIKGPASLHWLENQTTKKRAYMNIDILVNEEIFIDFGKGTVQSTLRGSLAWAIGQGSDIRDWTLIPGENRISALMLEDVGALMYIFYTPRHWSADATNRGEEL